MHLAPTCLVICSVRQRAFDVQGPISWEPRLVRREARTSDEWHEDKGIDCNNLKQPDALFSGRRMLGVAHPSKQQEGARPELSSIDEQTVLVSHLL